MRVLEQNWRVRILGFRETGWSDNQDVLTIQNRSPEIARRIVLTEPKAEDAGAP